MINRRQRYRLDSVKPGKQDPQARVHNFNEVSKSYSTEVAMEQASRCLYCEHAPCSQGCPLHNDIPGALFLLAQGDLVGAAGKFMETSNFPDVCGRICPQEKQCEGGCILGYRGTAVSIGKLEAFLVDYVRRNYGYLPRERAPLTGMSVGVVGAGPAGLAVAEELAVLGHSVTVYDMWPFPGGLLIYGIPNFKLNKEIVFSKIQYLEDLGVKFICNYRVGKDRLVEDLLKRNGHHLVFLGYGAIKGGVMKVSGEIALARQPRLQLIQRAEQVEEGFFVRFLRARKAAAIDAVVHIAEHERVDGIDVAAQRRGIVVGAIIGEGIERRIEHADDFR